MERLRCESFIKSLPVTNQIVRLIEVSALKDARFREVPLYWIATSEIKHIHLTSFEKKIYWLEHMALRNISKTGEMKR